MIEDYYQLDSDTEQIFRNVIQQMENEFDSQEFIERLHEEFEDYYNRLQNEKSGIREIHQYVGHVLSTNSEQLHIEKITDVDGDDIKKRNDCNIEGGFGQLWRRILLVIALMFFVSSSFAQSRLYADVNGDGEVNISDVNAVISVILGGTGTEPTPNPDPEDHEYVDLGLPSGTLWATCNVGACSPEEYGDYFAWGETTPKDYYDWSTYKWCNGGPYLLNKYCNNRDYGRVDEDGFVDDKMELDPEDDAAYVNWGPQWRMPTYNQQKELVRGCTWTWTTRNGVNGHIITGPNGNTLFLPAAGSRWYDSLNDDGKYGHYLSRSLDWQYCFNAYIIFLSSYRVDWSSSNRSSGKSVRAVRNSLN